MLRAAYVARAVGWSAMAALAAGAIACGDEPGSGLAGSNCGTLKTVSLFQTVTAAEALYTLATPVEPVINDVDCVTSYSLAFRWANPARASSDNTMPPLWNLPQALRFNGGVSYFVYDTSPELSSGAPYVWTLTYFDHAANRGLTSTDYSIVTTFLSNSAADSVHIEGSISYYVQ
jgi:hypothetical protein